MILAPNEYALILDETKGEIAIYVGPNKASLAGSDRPSVFDPRTNRFTGVALDKATQAFLTAGEGSYIVLENPAEGDKRPSGTGKLTTPTLRTGKKVNISGPTSFALWPGQFAKVLAGHNLKSNEFVLARVYDEEAAKDNWSKAVIKQQTDGTPSIDSTATDAPPNKAQARQNKAEAASRASSDIPSANELTMGKLFVIRGTEVSFYIPPTGIEIVPETVNGEERYVREAVTLERLEYCLLLDQNGNKRYVRGPAVVVPKPTEKFVDAAIKSSPDKARAKKFRAQELTQTSGIHIRVIADYVEDDGKTQRKEGEELFVTGKEQPVYFPREEHAIIKYGEQDVHYGIALPSGDTRYVLDRNVGVISVVKGPQIFVADPRNQVIAQRALPLDLCELLYPGNSEAYEVNAQRLGLNEQDIMGVGGANAAFLNSSYTRNLAEDENYGAVAAVATPEGARRGFMIKGSSKALPGDAFDRKSKFTAPRSVILNTKYDGAVQTTLWTGYAMLLVNKTGGRRVVQGPGTFTLEYDETPQVLSLSTGKPKNTDTLYRTVFLKTNANMVSDVIAVETKDFCHLNVKVSYRVNFEGDPNSWFNVDNYVKFLCDHMRSKVRAAVQKFGIEEFYGNHADILRDIVLGKSVKGEVRPGQLFTENGMRIYDVEVLGVQMQNADVEKLLVNAQREVIQNTLVLATERRKLDYVKENELIKREITNANAETRRLAMELQGEEVLRKQVLDLTVITSAAKTDAERLSADRASQEARAANELQAEKDAAAATAVKLEIQKVTDAQKLETQKAVLELELSKLAAQTDSLTKKAAAVSPDLIAALQAFGDKALLEKMSESMGPLAILGGKSVSDVLKGLVEHTPLAKHLEALATPSNGSATTATKGRANA